jgi:hypothetical protein
MLKVQVPVNTIATVYLPAVDENKIFESGLPLKSSKGGSASTLQQKGIKLSSYDNGIATLEIGSGSYIFESR